MIHKKQRFQEPDVIAMAELSKNVDFYLKQLKDTGRPMVIMQKGKAAGVLVSTLEYNQMIYSSLFMESVAKGAADVAAGLIMTTEEAKGEIEVARRLRKFKES